MKKIAKARTLDMTQGNSLKLLLTFAVPLLMGTLFQQIYTTVDTMVVGHVLGDEAISAIGSTSSIHMLLFNLAISLNNGYAIITTQAFGAHDEEKLRRSIAGMFVLDAGAVALLTALAVVFLRPMMIFMNTPVSIFEQAYGYMLTLFIGMFATIGYNMFASILRAMGNSRTPLYCLIVSSVTNVALDLLFVAVFSMGVIGAALATVIAQLVSMTLCGGAFFKHYRQLVPRRDDFMASRKLWPQMLTMGTSMAMMMCVVNIGSIIFQRANNSLGQIIITAHTAGHKLVNMLMQPMGTLAAACSTFVSQNWGAKQYRRIKMGLRQVMGMEILWSLIAIAIVYLLDGVLVRLISGTENPEVLSNATMAMRICVLGFPVLGILNCLRTSMQAMGKKVAPVLSSCVELVMKAVGAWVMIPLYGYFGSCLTEPLTWLAMTAFLAAAYWCQRNRIYPAEEG